MSQNIITALRTFLLADAGVAALVGDRIFGIELPKCESNSMPRQCVVITPSGGPSFQSGSTIRHAYQRVDIFSYGDTPFEAEAVRDAIDDALMLLRRGVTDSTLIHWVQSAGGWLTNRDTNAKWPMSFQSYQAFYALEAA